MSRQPKGSGDLQLVLPILADHERRIRAIGDQLSEREWLGTRLQEFIRREVERVVAREHSPCILEPPVEFVESRTINPLAIVGRARELLRQAHSAEDLDQRLDAIIRVKEVLEQAVAEARRSGPRPLKHGLVTVREAAETTYAEDLTDEQFLALEEGLARLQDADLDEEDVLDIAKGLLQSGLRPIPLLTREQREKAVESLGL